MNGAGERAVRVLLRLYPVSFRRRFEREIVEFYCTRRRSAPGRMGRARLLARTVVDLVTSLVREHAREFTARHANRGGAMATDLRHSLRTLIRNRAFSTMAVLTLALGIGANTAVFSLAQALFLTPLPFPEADRVVSVWERRGGSRDANLPLSGHEYAALREHGGVFEAVAMSRGDVMYLTGHGGDPEALNVLRASVDYFRVLEMKAAIGRVFAAGEDGPGAASVAVLSDVFWRRRFHGDRRIVGEKILLNDQAVTVIGIMTPLAPSLSPDAWMPIDAPAMIRAVGRHNLQVVALLAPEASLQQAQAEAEAVAARLSRELPRDNTDHHVTLVPVREEIAGEFRLATWTLLAAVGFVLLIGCANVANLLLTRGADRQKEIAVRIALGGSRLRIVRQLLTESVVLAAVAGSVGLLLAAWIIGIAPSLTVTPIPLIDTARIDWMVVALAAGLSLLTGLAAGIAPALRSSRAHPRWLREGSRIGDDPGRRRIRSILVAAEVALTLVLLVGAGLLINSFVRLVAVDPGIATDNVLAFGVDLPGSRYREATQRRAFADRLLESVRALPGIEAAGATSHLPLGGADNWMPFSIEGRPTPPPGQDLNAAFRVVTTDYFRTLNIPLRSGRFFSDTDARLAVPFVRWFPQQPASAGSDKPQPVPVALVSEAAVRQFWPGEDPVGRRIRVLFSPEVTVVGVVGDVRHNALNLPAYPHIYLSHNQEPWASLSVVVRTNGDTLSIGPAVRERVRALDPALPISIRTMNEVVSASVGRPRFYAGVVGTFGSIALGLAIVGIFGVVSYAAAQRTREIGVRIALGAQRREIAGLMIGQGMRPIVVGLAVGAAGAFYLTRFIKTMLFDVEPTDPMTFSVVVLTLGSVALLACWIPARRASMVDPVVTLRTE